MHPLRARFYEACQRENIGITVMKSLAAGALLTAERSPFGLALTPAQCIQYAMDRPAVGSVLVGASTPEEMEEACAYEQASSKSGIIPPCWLPHPSFPCGASACTATTACLARPTSMWPR